MHQHDPGDRWDGQEAAARDAQTGTFTAVSDSGQATAGSEVLARLPDLEADQANPEAGRKPAQSEGRLIGQRLSRKLLIGGGILLLLAAVVSWLINRNREPEGGQSPAPWAEVAPKWDSQQADGKQGTSKMSYTPDMSFDHAIPEGPAFLNPNPDTGTDPAQETPPWDDQQAIDAADARANAARWNYQAKQPGLRRQGYPSAPPAVGSPSNVPTPPAAERPTVPGRSPDRSDSLEARRPDWSYQRSYRHSMPEMISGPTRPRAETNRSMAIGVGSPLPAEPGVARLEGIIERPPVRTTYDRTGPSIH